MAFTRIIVRFPVSNNPIPVTEKGFTLIEVMAVLFMIGIMTAIVVINVGGQTDRKMTFEAQRIFEKAKLARDEAELTKNDIGLKFIDENHYQFLQFDDQLMTWKEIEKDPFKNGEVPDQFVMRDESDNKKATLGVLYPKKSVKIADYAEKERDQPDIVFFSDGSITPFRINISSKDNKSIHYFLVADAEGQILMSQEDK